MTLTCNEYCRRSEEHAADNWKPCSPHGILTDALVAHDRASLKRSQAYHVVGSWPARNHRLRDRVEVARHETDSRGSFLMIVQYDTDEVREVGRKEV